MASPLVQPFLEPDYLGDVTTRPIDEIRRMRQELTNVEVGLSYQRRLVQGRIDIVAAEVRRRADEGGPSDLSRVVEELPKTLAEHTRAPGYGRLPTLMEPSPQLEAELEAELEQVVSVDELTRVTEVDDEAIASLLERLTAFERTVSATRRQVFDRIDALQAELTRRYKSGEASVESLLQ